jgi:transcriptional regulator with XRE-family HTH domain
MRNRAADVGQQRARFLAARFGTELRVARVSAGLPQRQLATRAAVSQGFVSLIERGLRLPSWNVACRLAAACGCELGLRLYPSGGVGLRDSGQLGLAELVAAEVHRSRSVRLEVPVGDGSRRAVDMVLAHPAELLLIEIERGIADFQGQVRPATLKRDAVGAGSRVPVRLVLGIPDTRAHRRMLAEHRELIDRVLPVASRAIWKALRDGTPIGGDGILLIRVRRPRRA